MNEEEKEAIEAVGKIIEYLQNRNSDDIHISSKYNDMYGYVTMQFTSFADGDLQILVNIIEKLQKEIEKLKQDKEILYGVIDELKEDSISKDKIRDKIKELEKEKNKCFNENGFVPYYIQILINTNNKIVVLEELLGDDNND